jgi:hypothetical protein
MRLAAHACECPDCGSIHHCAEREIPFDPDGSIAYSFSSAEKNDAAGWTLHKAHLTYYLSDEEMKKVIDVLAGDPGLGEQARYRTFDPSVHKRAWRDEGDINVRFCE